MYEQVRASKYDLKSKPISSKLIRSTGILDGDTCFVQGSLLYVL